MSPLAACASLLILLSIQSSSGQSGVLAQHGILTASSNPFDGGRVGSCEVPTVTEVCSDYVDYPVPTSIARLAPILEDTIRSSLGKSLSDTCRQTYIEVQCRVRFPRCLQLQDGTESDYSQVQLNHQNCSVLRTACDESTGASLENVCNGLTAKTVPSSNCTPLSDRDYNFEYCNFPNADNILVTEWMFQLMRFEDHRSDGQLFMDAGCGQGLASFLCSSVGQCTSSGEEIVYVNTHESCNDVVNCYGDDYQVLAQSEVSCSLWPQAHLQYQPTTPIPDSSPGIKTGTKAGTTSKDDNTIDIDMFLNQFSTGVMAKQCLAWTIVAVLIGLVLS